MHNQALKILTSTLIQKNDPLPKHPICFRNSRYKNGPVSSVFPFCKQKHQCKNTIIIFQKMVDPSILVYVCVLDFQSVQIKACIYGNG